MIAYRGPTLIAEPELRWPILILAAVITLVLAMFAAGLYYVAMTQSDAGSYTEPRLEAAVQPGQPKFEEFRSHIESNNLKASGGLASKVRMSRLETVSTVRGSGWVKRSDHISGLQPIRYRGRY
jgi:hypothetical protein